MIVEVSRLIADAFSDGRKVILFGNGGSSSAASHMASEFVNKFKRERPGLPAIAVNTDMAVLTAIANDYDFSEIFSRQIKALAEEGDIVMGISTSGNSPNVLKALDAARRKKLKTVVMTGLKGKSLKADFVFVVPSDSAPRVQEAHITLGHVLCQMVEELLFDAPSKK